MYLLNMRFVSPCALGMSNVQACYPAAQGKTLLLITNSDFNYTDKLMRYSFDPYLPEGFSWRDLFDMVRQDPVWCSGHAE